MKTLKFDVDFIDKQIIDLPDKGIYLFSEKNSDLRLHFLDRLLQTNLQRSISCMLITNIVILKENDVIKKNVPKYLYKDNFTLLEIPQYINNFIHGSVDMNQCINDLKIYIDNIEPSLIVIQHVELLLKENQNYINTTLLSQFLNFLYTLKTCTVIDVSSFDDDDIQICEKFTSGNFHFIYSEGDVNNQLILKNCKNIKDDFEIIFTMDHANKISTPSFRIDEFISIHECKQLILNKELTNCEELFLEMFTSKIEFLYYETFDDLNQLTIDYKFALFLVLAHSKQTNGWLLLPMIRKKYPFCKIMFLGSVQTPVYQKVRAIKKGADKFAYFPLTTEILKKALNEMYYFEEDDHSKHQIHKILYVSDEFISAEKPLMLYKQTLSRFIKDFAFLTATKGETIHFYKCFTHRNSLNEVDEMIDVNRQIVFISSYFIENKQLLFFIYKNINNTENAMIISKLKKISHSVMSKYSESVLSNIFQNHNLDIQRVVFPLEKTNIETILEWIYDGF